MKTYSEHPALGGLSLEDSFVLGLMALPGVFEIRGDIALTSAHARFFWPPKRGEALAFAPGALRFERVKDLRWTGQGSPAAVDASGETDYGAIDRFEWEGDQYLVEGQFGRIEVICSQVVVDLDD